MTNLTNKQEQYNEVVESLAAEHLDYAKTYTLKLDLVSDEDLEILKEDYQHPEIDVHFNNRDQVVFTKRGK